MKNTVEITITGTANSGKSALARELAHFLRSRGFGDVVVNDIDVERYGERDAELHERCVQSLISKAAIIIETQQRLSHR